ncbi:MAG: Crp/Fnr family transcriptional regulator [Chloroflexi bacterium]|nr:Crp/Fnr family transcriptional regulator [Chloroflexota bacterium]PWB45529.1 MAG: hypothetical protein C3F10_06025 [Dehalococcoidia bacterium]
MTTSPERTTSDLLKPAAFRRDGSDMEFVAEPLTDIPVLLGNPSLLKRRGPAFATQMIDVVKSCPLFFGIDKQTLEELVPLCQLLTFRRHEQIFAEGEPSRGLWVLVRGRVRLFHADAGGRQILIGFPGLYTPIDLPAALDRGPHTVAGVALEHSQLLFFSQPAVAQLENRFPDIRRNAMLELCRDLRQRDISHAISSLRDARGRICCTLLQLTRQYGIRRFKRVTIAYRLNRQDLADRSGVALETASRVVSELQRGGLLETRDHRIDILDQAAIEVYSQCQGCELDCSVFRKPTARDFWPSAGLGLRDVR